MIFDAKPYRWIGRNKVSKKALGWKTPAVEAVQLNGSYRARKIKGAVNIRAVLAAAEAHMKTLREQFDEVGFDPKRRLVQMIATGELASIDPALEARTLVGLMEYLEPKLRATTVTVNNRPVGELTESELLELVQIRDEAAGGGGVVESARGEVIPLRLCAPVETVSNASETP